MISPETRAHLRSLANAANGALIGTQAVGTSTDSSLVLMFGNDFMGAMNFQDFIASANPQAILSLLDLVERMEQEREDLAMLIKRFCRAWGTKERISVPKLMDQARDYLKRKGLEGSILRDDAITPGAGDVGR